METQARERWRGIVAINASIGCFAGMNVALKTLVAYYPALQVGALRSLIVLPFVALLLGWKLNWRQLWPVRLMAIIAVSALGTCSMLALVAGLKAMSISDAYAIFFISPLLMAALSVPILKERVDWQSWLAILAGLAGVMVMLQPTGSGGFSQVALLVLFSAVGFSLYSILRGQLARQHGTAVVLIWVSLFMALFSTAAAVPSWQPINPQHWPWLLAAGVAAAAGQYFIIDAFRRAPAAVVAPFEYSSLLWSMVVDWLIWQVFPASHVLVGAAVVAGCGLYVMYRERTAH